jgi:thioredoxin 1
MKKSVLFLLGAVIFLFSNNLNGQPKPAGTVLPALKFSELINKNPGSALIDVRTPEEFAKGHISNAINIDWKGNDFQTRISMLDKAKPVFIYCLAGSRAAAAADQMRADGFREVYELKGGILKWRTSGLPEETNKAIAGTGLSRIQFDELLNTEKPVLIHFYAEWCSHCKKMKPYMDEIAVSMKEKITVIRISVDDNQSLCKELKIDAVPVLNLYRNRQLIWTNEGYIPREEVLMHLKDL